MIMLRAIDPPDHSNLTFEDTLSKIKLNERRKVAFKKLLQRVQMNLWTLHFRSEYENAYRRHLYDHSVRRIRYTMALGVVFILLKSGYEYMYTPAKRGTHSVVVWKMCMALQLGAIFPALAFALLCTFVRRLNWYCEYYASLPFLVSAAVFTAQKIMMQQKGPLFALFIVFVPVFGITRFRFTASMILVMIMLGGHIAGLGLVQDLESITDIIFQGYNYLGGIVVGAVCHYREEVLRRRNYAMMLPFSDEPFDAQVISDSLNDPRVKKSALLNMSTLKFKNPFVEESFYRHWYLIDSCPFDHPNAGELHRGVFRTIRYAIGGAVAAQLLLAIQDWEYLRPRDNGWLSPYKVATIFRFAIVIPAYAACPLAMYCCGQRYYKRWRAKATSECRGGLRSPVSASGLQLSYSSYTTDAPSPSPAQDVRTPLSPTKSVPFQGEAPKRSSVKMNYVRKMQWMSAVVVLLHSLGMGVILLLVDMDAKHTKGTAAPCYLIGFLNAILFPHRSGFRVRFIYATWGTSLVTAAFVMAAMVMKNMNALQYGAYALLTHVLGMMISFEEESLRRIFFVRIAVRSEEFARRHAAINQMERWFNAHIRRWRKARALLSSKTAPAPSAETTKIPTINQMGLAAKYGMVFEIGKTAMALVTEVV
ncbi:TPA: hypothetical protein N0F65_008664 [Lagenidium giganteum]|uniref:Transmembrane protein n=1 Tax=Lagenidium giganteum TaxID=4803 RepID=A0AAV2ZCV7_9STRA|nr:TPA: hypothetical protein N0F65_008664 [Lagenidium giganteum]